MYSWMKYCKHSTAPEQYKIWSFMSVLAGALERRVWLTKNHDIGWYANLYLFIIGPPGSGKSVIAESAMRLLQEVDGISFLANDINSVTLLEDLEAIGKKKVFTWNGVDYPHSAATIFATEGAETFQEQAKNIGIITRLTSLFNGGQFGWSMTHGTNKRSTKTTGKTSLLNPCVNLLACSTPEWLLTRCMTKNDADGGFGSRILLAVSKDSLEVDGEWERPDQKEDLTLRSNIIHDLKMIAQMQGPYISDLTFKDAWRYYANEYNKWKKANCTGIFGGYQERKITQHLKIAMCIAASRRQELVITGADLETAAKMLNAIEPAMINMLSDLEMSRDAKIRREIFTKLESSAEATITKGDVIRMNPRFDFVEVMRSIEALVAMGKLVIIEERSGFARTLYQIIREQPTRA